MGTFGGALKDFSATDLGVVAAEGAIAKRRHRRRGRVDTWCSATRCRPRPTPSTWPATSGCAPGCRRSGRRSRSTGCAARLPGDRHRGHGDPAGRDGGGALRRRRVDEPGAARGARRPLGRPAPGAGRQVLRGPALGGAHRHLRRLLDGDDGREPGRAARHHPRGGGRLCPPLAAARQAGVGRGPLRVADRPGHHQDAQGRDVQFAARRAHAPGDDRRERSRSCAPTSRRAAPSPPATPRASATARRRW
jgi:hypothetical protein